MKKLVSVCTPAYNESDCVVELLRRLAAVAEVVADRYDFEFIVCENGSVDDTYEKLIALRANEPRLKIVRLSRNFGTEGGMTAAIAHARGDAAVLMNADLQDPPEYIPQMLEFWEKGYQNVYAIVSKRTGESAFRRLCATTYYAIVQKLSDAPVVPNVSDFRLVDSIAYRTYLQLPERYRMVRFMWSWMGFRSIGIDTERPQRAGGRSSFRFFAMLHSGLRSILAQTRAPLTIIPTLGIGLATLSFALLATYLVKAAFFGVPFDGFGTIVALMLLLFSFLFCFLWMISEYIGLIFEEVRHRPMFIVSETHGLDARELVAEPVAVRIPTVVP
jgi:dolichol-phosphate mannosyltransferase